MGIKIIILAYYSTSCLRTYNTILYSIIIFNISFILYINNKRNKSLFKISLNIILTVSINSLVLHLETDIQNIFL